MASTLECTPKLRQDILDVTLDREDADRQRLSNLLCRATISEQRENLTLSPCQGIDLVGATLAELETRTRSTRAARWVAGRISSPAAARRIVSGTVPLSPVRVITPHAPAAITEARYPDRTRRSPRGPGRPRALRDLSDELDRRSDEFDREHIYGDFRRGGLRFSRVSNRPEHGDALVTTRKGEVVREPQAPLHHQHSNVDIHLHGCIGMRRSPSEAADWTSLNTPRTDSRAATSPYLRQHAHNPVDWYPWGDEAFERARERDIPVFLSVGYAACHWCHVMERESFEDADTAGLLNDHFVSIKVDREERPDIDAVYMDAVQAMTGSGGWPMSVFLTPERRPFYAATYLPDTPRYGMPSFRQVLDGIRVAWTPAGTRSRAGRPGHQYHRARDTPGGGAFRMDGSRGRGDRPSRADRGFDPRWGGFGGAPKFPQPTVIEWLLRRAARGDDDALSMATRTLDRMAWGGIHDQVDGGFFRYSTDAAWHVPHFEKMLYDNAQLLQVYATPGCSRATRLSERPPNAPRSSCCVDAINRRRIHILTRRRHRGRRGSLLLLVWDGLVATWADRRRYSGHNPGNWEGTNVLWLAEGPPDAAVAAGGSTVDLDAARRLLRETRDNARIPPSTTR